MTWGGAQGFQTPIEPESFTVENFGVFGNEHSERGLTCEWHNLYQILRAHNDSHPFNVQTLNSTSVDT